MTALSVLDQSPVPSGSTAATALHDTLALAQAAERLGYRRYWLAEHHNTISLAGTAPEVLAAAVASRTSSIRVGAGGVLLPYYSPLKVAEAFRVLHALFPGRIDLGIGRTPGADAVAAAALQRGVSALDDEHHPDQVADLVGFLHDRTGPDHRFAGVRAMPDGAGAPGVWVLGSSSYSASLAAGMGLSYSFAHFISPAHGPQIMAAYRDRFRPSSFSPAPRASVGVSVICAETDAEAERLATSQDRWRLRPEGAERGPLLSVEEAQAAPVPELEQVLMTQHRSRRLTGAPDRVRDSLRSLAGAYGVDELVVVTICHDPKARLRSYELLAEAFA
ncbi:MAG: LLM class flavin-dependent oxidoreductase [Acidimicrobiales bacterium]